jgi:hypothetical protein
MEELVLITIFSASIDGRRLQKIEEYLAANAVRTRNAPHFNEALTLFRYLYHTTLSSPSVMWLWIRLLEL